MKRTELGLRMVAMGVFLVLVLTLASAKGDDCACVASSAVDSIASLAPVSPTATDAASTSLFLVALNSERSKLNLQPVIGKLTLERVAAKNNAIQAINGIGHYTLEGFGQCAAGPFATMAQALTAWLHSPAHRALILAPDLSEVGYHQSGQWHTVSTWQGGVRDLDPTDRNDPRNYTFGPVASYGSPMVFVGQTKTIVSKPAPKNVGAAQAVQVGAGEVQCASSVPGPMYRQSFLGCGAESTRAALLFDCSPGRRGFHPLQRLLGRLRVQVSVGVQVSF